MPKLTTSEEAQERPTQHIEPCPDCPWDCTSIPGWLGTLSAEEWLHAARQETIVQCHCYSNQQCAGIAIYRRNTCKLPRPPNLILPADREHVFSNHNEFIQYHARKDSAHQVG